MHQQVITTKSDGEEQVVIVTDMDCGIAVLARISVSLEMTVKEQVFDWSRLMVRRKCCLAPMWPGQFRLFFREA